MVFSSHADDPLRSCASNDGIAGQTRGSSDQHCARCRQPFKRKKKPDSGFIRYSLQSLNVTSEVLLSRGKFVCGRCRKRFRGKDTTSCPLTEADLDSELFSELLDTAGSAVAFGAADVLVTEKEGDDHSYDRTQRICYECAKAKHHRADVTGRVQTELQQRLTLALKQALPTLTSLGLQRMCEVKAMVRLLPHDNDVMIVTITEQERAIDATMSTGSMDYAQSSLKSASKNEVKSTGHRISVKEEPVWESVSDASEALDSVRVSSTQSLPASHSEPEVSVAQSHSTLVQTQVTNGGRDIRDTSGMSQPPTMRAANPVSAPMFKIPSNLVSTPVFNTPTNPVSAPMFHIPNIPVSAPVFNIPTSLISRPLQIPAVFLRVKAATSANTPAGLDTQLGSGIT